MFIFFPHELHVISIALSPKWNHKITQCVILSVAKNLGLRFFTPLCSVQNDSDTVICGFINYFFFPLNFADSLSLAYSSSIDSPQIEVVYTPFDAFIWSIPLPTIAFLEAKAIAVSSVIRPSL